MDSGAPTVTGPEAGGGRWRTGLLRAASLVWIGFIVLAFVGLHQEWAGFRFADLKAALAGIGWREILLALGYTGLSYVAQAGLGWFAQRSQGHPSRSTWRELVNQFMIAAFSANAGGSAAGGGGIRQRFAAEQAVHGEQVEGAAAVAGLANRSGQLALGGVLLCGAPSALPGLPEVAARVLGAVLLLASALLGFFGFRQPARPAQVPSRTWFAVALGLSMLSWVFAGLALRALLPGGLAVGLWPLVTVVVVAHAAASCTMVPGELGVLEYLLMRALHETAPAPVLAAALFSYRLVFYLAPLAGSALGLWARDVRPPSGALERGGKLALRGWSLIAPRLAGWLALTGGFLLLLSANTPMQESRRGIVALVPLPFVEASHFISSLAGALLIVLARGLQRRIRTAWWLSLCAMAGGVVFSLVKGFDWEEALVLAFLLVCLLSNRSHFHRQAALWTHRFTVGWWLAILALAGVTVWMGFFSARHVPYRDDLWWKFALEGDASRFLRAMTGAAGVFLVVGLAQALRAAKPRVPAPPPDWEIIDRLVLASDHSDAALAWLGDKQFAVAADRSCALMYADQGRTRVVAGGPLGDSNSADDLLWQFVEQAQDEGMRPVFFQIPVSEMPRLVDMGFKLYKLGEEGRVPLAAFTLDGSTGRKLRHARSRFQREGLRFAIWEPGEAAANIPLLRVVSDAWLSEHRAGEKGFTLGRFDPDFLTRFPCGVVRDPADRVIAFATLWMTASKEEFSVDLMRHLPDTPNGVMEGMFVELILWGQSQGYLYFNLGMAPLSGLSTHPLAPMWHHLATLIFRRGESLYNFRGLRGYKEKFNPEWEPRYLAVPSSWSLPSALIDITTLTGGGLRRTFGLAKTELPRREVIP